MATLIPGSQNGFAPVCTLKDVFKTGKSLQVCGIKEQVNTKTNLSYVTAEIGGFEFTNIGRKRIGSKNYFETTDINIDTVGSGVNCVDIDWNGVIIDDEGTEFNHTTDVIQYIKDIKDTNTELEEKNAELEEKNSVLENYITNYCNTDYRIWNYDHIYNLDTDEYFSDSAKVYSDVNEMANYVNNTWNKSQVKSLRTEKDGTQLWKTKLYYPVDITNKNTSMSGVSSHYYQSLSTYAYPDEIYAVHDSNDDTITRMSRREYDFLTKLPANYKYGILTPGALYEYLNYEDLYNKYYDEVHGKAGAHLSETDITENANRYSIYNYYYNITSSTTKTITETELNKLYPDGTVTHYIPENYLIIYKVKNLTTTEFEYMFRNDYLVMFASEYANYELYITYKIDDSSKKDYYSDYSPVLDGDYYYIDLTLAQYNSLGTDPTDSTKSLKDYLTRKYTYVLDTDIYKTDDEGNITNEVSSTFNPISDATYETYSSDLKANLVKIIVHDMSYPNNSYSYITRDCNMNTECYDYDLSVWSILSDELYSFALAYYYKRTESYYEHFVEQLKIFFINEDTKMTPEYLYSQFHPGYKYSFSNYSSSTFDFKTDTSLVGQYGGIIDTQTLVKILETIKFMNSVKSIGTDVYIGIQQWFNDLVHWLYESSFAEKEGNAEYADAEDYVGSTNYISHPDGNHQINYWCNLYIFSKFANTYTNYTSSFEDIVTRHINIQIDENGVMPQEARRENALTYSVMNIEFIINACILFGREYTKTNLTKVLSALQVLQKFTSMTKAEYLQQTWLDIYGKKGAAGSTQYWTETGDYDSAITKLKFEINRFINLWPKCGLTKEDIDFNVIKKNREYIVK